MAQDWDWAKGAGGSDYDVGFAIAVDGFGNSYITGTISGTVSFGTISVTSVGDSDIFVAKYDFYGNLLWVRSAGGKDSDEGLGIAVEPAGNVYVTGYFKGGVSFGDFALNSAGDDDIDMFIAKYDGNGNVLWVKGMGALDYDGGLCIAIDAASNCYVTGYFKDSTVLGNSRLGSNGGSDIFVAKYDSSGNALWAKNAGGNLDDQGSSIAADAAGNCYVTGFYRGTATFSNIAIKSIGDKDVFLSKYDPDGKLLWVRSAGGFYSDWGNAVTVDNQGNSYITGHFKGSANFGNLKSISAGDKDIFIAKYDKAGNILWTKAAGGKDDYDEGNSIAVDTSGNVFVAGHFMGSATFGKINLASAGNSDLFVAKYDKLGNTLWAKSAGGSEYDGGRGIALDAAGNVYVTGYFRKSIAFGNNIRITLSGYEDIFLTKIKGQ